MMGEIWDGDPSPLVPTWLLACYFCIVVGGGIIANIVLVTAAVRARRSGRQRLRETPSAVGWDCGGWWLLVGQLAMTDALLLLLVSGGELWSLREASGPWRFPRVLCAPFMGLETALTAAQTYLLVAMALHAHTTPSAPIPDISIWHPRSAVVPSLLVWMFSTAMSVPRTFLAVRVTPRPGLPLCTLLPTSPTTGAPEAPLDGDADPWASGGPVLTSIFLCVAPAIILFATALLRACHLCKRRMPAVPQRSTLPHKRVRREWVRVSTWLSVTWLSLSLPRALAAVAHALLPPPATASAFRVPPLGSRALPDAALLAASMLHYALTAARPVLAGLVGPTLRQELLRTTAGTAGAVLESNTIQDDEDSLQEMTSGYPVTLSCGGSVETVLC